MTDDSHAGTEPRYCGERVEFYAPFAHIPDRYEACRIHTEEYGSFDTFIVIHGGTERPVTVYVRDDAGARFMAEQYPESRCIRLPEGTLQLTTGGGGRSVRLRLRSDEGPLREVDLSFRAEADAELRAVPYGGEGFAVWGSRWICSGVDMNATATVRGYIRHQDAVTESVETEAIIALGSVGYLTPRS